MRDAMQDAIGGLWNASSLLLSSVSGTNTLTATVTPVLTGAPVNGMRFSFVATATNTGAMTLQIGADTARAIVNTSGDPLSAGLVNSGWTYEVIYNGGEYVLLGQSATPRIADYQVFTASGTWTKPASCPDNALVIVDLWGAGGGGSSIFGGGGGGGAWVRKMFRAVELTSTVAVTIGAGGATGNPATVGGSTTFGAYLTAYGGGGAGGYVNVNQRGGGGSGAGTSAAGAAGASTGVAVGGFQGGGGGGLGSIIGGDPATSGSDATTENGGGGGGGGDPDALSGGRAIHGGGGGGNGRTGSLGGVSLHGGNGGNPGANGQAPSGGGGGGGGNGARGEARIRTIG